MRTVNLVTQTWNKSKIYIIRFSEPTRRLRIPSVPQFLRSVHYRMNTVISEKEEVQGLPSLHDTGTYAQESSGGRQI